MNERIRELRKTLGLTMEEFGKRIGIKKSSISLIENGKNGTTDQTVLSICREFNVNEQWLRTGEGEMFLNSRQSALDRLAEEYRLDERKKALVASFLQLSASDQEAILRFIDSAAAELSTIPSKPDLDIEAEVERYRQELLSQRQAEAGSFPSAGFSSNTG